MAQSDDEVPPDAAMRPELVRAFAALQSLLLSAQDVDEFLTETVSLAAEVVDPQASCSITVSREGQPLTIVSSDDRAAEVDERQYGDAAGPCLDTLRSGAVNDVPDLTADTRWPAYAAHAVAMGLGSSLSLPLSVGGRTLGGLNLYGARPYAFNAGARQHAEMFATQAATALALLLRTVAHAEQSSQLEQALHSRTVIDQAIGILMAQQRCTAAEAFGLLRAHSQNNNRKLREVAAELITRVTGRPPEAGRGFER